MGTGTPGSGKGRRNAPGDEGQIHSGYRRLLTNAAHHDHNFPAVCSACSQG